MLQNAFIPKLVRIKLPIKLSFFGWYAKPISVHVKIIGRHMNRTNNIHSSFWRKCFCEMKYSRYFINFCIILNSWKCCHHSYLQVTLKRFLMTFLSSFAMLNGIISTIKGCHASFFYHSVSKLKMRRKLVTMFDHQIVIILLHSAIFLYVLKWIAYLLDSLLLN